MNKITHYAFSDESLKGRYEALGMISLPSNELKPVEQRIKKICGNYKIKWNKIEGFDKQSTAFRIIKYIIQKALEGKLRVDVLIWDKTDSRHNIQQRDDTANLQRMYYRLLENVMGKRWPRGSFWEVYADRYHIDWRKLEKFLKLKGRNLGFHIVSIQESTPSEHPLINVADLFAGMGHYSWNRYEKIKEKERLQTGQQFLILPAEKIELSGRDYYRSGLINDFHKKCKEKNCELV